MIRAARKIFHIPPRNISWILGSIFVFQALKTFFTSFYEGDFEKKNMHDLCMKEMHDLCEGDAWFLFEGDAWFM